MGLLGAVLAEPAQYHDAADWLERVPVDDTGLPLDVRAAALGGADAIAYYTHDDVDGAERFWHEGSSCAAYRTMRSSWVRC